MKPTVVCRGSKALGNACGRCHRCTSDWAPMTVYGVEIPGWMLNVAWDEAKAQGLSYLTLKERLEAWAHTGKFDVIARCADRLLQRQRKAGACRYEAGKWVAT